MSVNFAITTKISFTEKQLVQRLISASLMGFTGPLKQTHHGNQCLLMAAEYLSKCVILKPMKSQTSIKTIKFFDDEIVCQFRGSGKIITKGDPAFVFTTWWSALKSEWTAAKIFAPYSPQETGWAERIARKVKAALHKLILNKADKWDTKIRTIERFYRTSSASDGLLTFDMMYSEQYGRQNLWLRIFLEGNNLTILDSGSAQKASQMNANFVEMMGMYALRAEK